MLRRNSSCAVQTFGACAAAGAPSNEKTSSAEIASVRVRIARYHALYAERHQARAPVPRVTPLPYSWPALVPFWIACAWSFSAELPFIAPARRDVRATPSQDLGSYRLIIWAGVSASAAAFSAAAVWPAAAITYHVPVYVAGIACGVGGGLLRRHCFTMLGQRLTFVVKATADQAVVDAGAYKYVRHPSYTALSVTPLALAYAYRMTIEERALMQAIGAPYEDYMKRTRRLIPFVL